MARALKSADVVRVLEEDGLEIITNTPAEFAAMIRDDGKIWDDAAATAGLIPSP
jgi:tripartite-type tricarboxylate transporter receptor subunit TctC